MSSPRDEGPVYYREIQKNAYLKRIPNEVSGSKLLPLSHKKPPLKPMWTLLCVHNGRTPFLEQYPEAESAATLAHRPVWRACLRSTRHVTAGVRPHAHLEHDFLVDTDHGPVRMLAPDWESMQEWVTTLRNKLHELRILSKGENVYAPPPAAPVPRAAARDPTSPLPPTPPVPPDRVPGIELTTPVVRPTTVQEPPPEPASEPPTLQDNPQTIDISDWDADPVAGTSQEIPETKTSVAKICGQNICLDDSILKRNATSTDSDEEFFAEIDRIHNSMENIDLEASGEGPREYKQRVVVNDATDKAGSSHSVADAAPSERQATNITVIQVSNKPPHTAIPVLGPETDVFDFNFKQNVPTNETFVNIVNTEDAQNTTDNSYGTVFTKESDYGHLSLTTTVNLTGDVKVTDNEGVYERLCLASTSNTAPSPLPVRKIKSVDKNRKSSLPNLDVASSSESTYEYLFPNVSQNNNARNTTNITLNDTNGCEINSNVNEISTTNISRNNISGCDTRHKISDVSRNNINNTNDISRNNIGVNDVSRSNIGVNDGSRSNISVNDVSRSNIGVNDVSRSNIGVNDVSRSNIGVIDVSRNNITNTDISRNNISNEAPRPVNVHVNLTNSISVGNTDLSSRSIRSNVERSHSQNAYDSTPRLRDHLIRRVQNNSPKRDAKSDKSEAPNSKPIWKRGLTELSLLSRLRGIGQGKRQESPTRNDSEASDRGVTSPAKVVHRSRPEARVDSTRRRSSSLSNGQSPAGATGASGLQPLRARQAAALRAEQRLGAAAAGTVPARDPPVFADYSRQVWVAWWGPGGPRCGGRAGDRVAALRGTTPRDAQHARHLLKTSPTHLVDILFHRVPLGKIYVLNKRDLESTGIKLDSSCEITRVESGSPAARAGIPPAGRWAVTEVNNRSLNLLKGGDEEITRLSAHGVEVSVLLQPAALVRELRKAAKAAAPLRITR